MKALMRKILWILLLLLAGCGGNEKTASSVQTALPSTSRVPVLSAATSFALLPTPTVLQNQVEPTAALVLDPGPYFTPERSAPTGKPEEFTPPVVVNQFTLMQVRGNCLQANGQTAEYINQNREIIYLTCQYTGSTRTAQNQIHRLPQVFNVEPVQIKVQSSKSFALLPSGAGFVYAWTQDAWYFTARSLNGRDLLDDFMQNFPY